MAFWNSTKLPTPPNAGHLTASQQRSILSEAKLNKNQINQLKKTLKSAKDGNNLLNRNKRISLGKMQEIIKQYDPKLAQKLKQGFDKYNKQVQKKLNQVADKNVEHSLIAENIKKTRKYDIKRERSLEYMKEKLAKQKLKGIDPNAEKEHKDKYGKYHALDRPTTSISNIKPQNSWTTIAHSAQKSAQKQPTKTMEELREEVKNLPDLPI